MQRVVSRIEEAPVSVVASGRTDAGVHALAQVAAFTLTNPIPLENLRPAINHLLPPSIRVLAVEEAAPDFQPRFDATSKIYEYRIWRDEICPPFDRPYVHHYPYPLNEPAMFAAAKQFEGEHDFSCFAASDPSDSKAESKFRRIFSSTLTREGSLLIYRVRGSGFLKHMVRKMVGTLIQAGKGNVTPEGLAHFLSAPPKVKAGPTAPASGLFLVQVFYGEK